MPMLKSMYSFPSTSHTCEPFPFSRYFGAIPFTFCWGPFANVCVVAGIRSKAILYNSSDLSITG